VLEITATRKFLITVAYHVMYNMQLLKAFWQTGDSCCYENEIWKLA